MLLGCWRWRAAARPAERCCLGTPAPSDRSCRRPLPAAHRILVGTRSHACFPQTNIVLPTLNAHNFCGGCVHRCQAPQRRSGHHRGPISRPSPPRTDRGGRAGVGLCGASSSSRRSSGQDVAEAPAAGAPYLRVPTRRVCGAGEARQCGRPDTPQLCDTLATRFYKRAKSGGSTEAPPVRLDPTSECINHRRMGVRPPPLPPHPPPHSPPHSPHSPPPLPPPLCRSPSADARPSACNQ